MSKCLECLVIFGYFLIVVQAQSEIINRFLNLNRENITITKACDLDLNTISASLQKNEIWALKFLDASGSPESGFVWGNNFWLGSQFSCLLLNEPPTLFLGLNYHRQHYPNLTDVASPMPVEYRVFYVRFSSKLQVDLDIYEKNVLHVGVCFPSSCTDQDSLIMGEKVFKREKWPKHSLLGEIQMMSSKNVKLRKGFILEPFILLFIIVTSIFLILSIVGTSYTIYRKSSEVSTDQINEKESQLQKYLSYFSIIKNTHAIFTTKVGKNILPAVNGIRAISMAWIIVSHPGSYGYLVTDNFQGLLSYYQSWILQPIYSATVSVDTFYFLSGFLMSFSFFESQKKKPTKHPNVRFLKVLFNRLIRITPFYVIMIILAASLSTYLNDISVFRQFDNNEVNCKLYWWRNLLFIQNFWPMSEMCITWSYYLATDFQLYIVACLLHLVYLKSKKLCVGLSVILVAATALYSGYLGSVYAFSFSYDSHVNVIDVIYTKPFGRIGVYLIGFWSAWYLGKIDSTLKISKRICLSIWTLTISITTFLVYVQHFQEPSHIYGALFPAFGRTLWAVALGLMLVTCASGNGGIIARILNSKVWLALSRISFTTFLVNPMVCLLILFSSEKAFHQDVFLSPLILIGFLVVSYIFSFVFAVFFESPLTKIISHFVIK